MCDVLAACMLCTVYSMQGFRLDFFARGEIRFSVFLNMNNHVHRALLENTLKE